MKCPGCDGRCWVDSQHKGPSVCPVCKGLGSIAKRLPPVHDKEKVYDQDATWTELTRDTPLDFGEALDSAIKVLDHPDLKASDTPYSFIVHLLFDKNVTPQGNLILEQVRLGSLRTGQTRKKLSPEHLRAKGYCVLPEGGVQAINDVPVGRFYNILVKWGMARSIVIDVNRKGNPYFMDGNMVAFGVTYGEVECIRESLDTLNSYCVNGVAEAPELKPVGQIVNLRLFFLRQGI